MRRSSMTAGSLKARRRCESGFSLVELAVVLVVVGALMSFVAVCANVQRVAEYNALLSRFFLGWREAYETYYTLEGPLVSEEDVEPLCEEALLERMMSLGVELPAGRARGAEDRAVYLAPDGLQRQVDVCFLVVEDWFAGLDAEDEPELVQAYVLRITNLSSDLARKLDTAIDGYADAGWGAFRSEDAYASGDPDRWPDLYAPTGELVSVTAYWRMGD